MAAIKVTFTLDHNTITRLNDAAQRLAIPKSEVVREAIHDYHARIGKLSETERKRMLDAFDHFVPLIEKRPAADADRELSQLRRARQAGGRPQRKRRRL